MIQINSRLKIIDLLFQKNESIDTLYGKYGIDLNFTFQGTSMALLQGLLTTLFVILCFMLIFIILLQKGKGGTGLFSNMGNANVKLFGGSGGQDLFQKITWVLAFLFLGGSLGLALMRSTGTLQTSRILDHQVDMPVAMPEETAPASAEEPQE